MVAVVRLLEWSVLLALLAGYAAFVAAWIALKRRLGLTGPRAPPRQALDRPAWLARRSLRALLAFDFLLILPVMLLTCVAAGAAGDLATGLLVLLPATVFLLPAWPLLRHVRAHDARLAAGLPAPSAAEALAAARTVGHAGLDALLAGRPPVTTALLLVITATSVAAWLLPHADLYDRLAKVNGAILAGEVWRLVTVALVHANLLHLLGNGSVLQQVARPLERLAGRWALLAVFVLGTAAGTAASVAFIPGPSVGASGGVFAVTGALVAFGWRHRAILPEGLRRKVIRSAAITLALNLVITFSLPFIDWAAHLGGLLAGLALGALLRPTAAVRAALTAGPTA